jgi:hypothetical protein
MAKQNWFDTLNDSLNSENLIDAWDITFSPIGYGETRSWTWDEGSKYGRYISIYRDSNGRYERPVTYLR